MDFQGRQIIVTGGTGTLGLAVVGALTAAGATCHIPCINLADAQASLFKGRADVRLIPSVDLTRPSQVESLFAGVANLWASIHIAGGFGYGALATTDLKLLRQQIDMNLMTCLLCCSGAVGVMSNQGQGGRIVNVAARAGLEWRQGANMATYAAAKAAVAALTVALAEEVVESNILVNAVAPSIIDTASNRAECRRPTLRSGQSLKKLSKQSCS